MNRALLSAIALCFIAAGCDSKSAAPASQPKAAAAVTPLPPAAPQPPAASANQDAAPMKLAQAGPPAQGCSNRHNNCMVKISVDENADGTCKVIKKDPDPLGVWKGDAQEPNRPVKITWQIVASGNWEFASNGIDFAGNPKFTQGTLDGTKKKFTWTDANDDSAKHDYTVHLVNGAKKCDNDPSIVNGVLVEL